MAQQGRWRERTWRGHIGEQAANRGLLLLNQYANNKQLSR
jgi:hypothetical protein